VLELACPPAAGGVRELERPQEIRCLLEVRSSGEDLVHKVLDGEDIILSKRRLDDAVVGEWDALLVDFAISALVDKFTDGFQVRLAVCDIRLDETEHLLSCLRDLDENTVVNLKKTQQLEDFARFGCDLVDTPDSDDKVNLRLSWYIEIASRPCGSLQANLLFLLRQILLHITLGALENDFSLRLGCLFHDI